MRKYNKTQCIELIKTLEEAHSEIRKYINNKDINTAAALLEQCQQAAISIGEIVEASEGEGTDAVGRLEAYCELTYNIHEDLMAGKPVNAMKTEKRLRKVIRSAQNSINSLPTQYEAVFLPYKASMWDSLESIWMAADEDESCTAYVIPIPYYDKNPDGSFKELYYERMDYPSYVPITGYADYDFEGRHPDMIFIHNPYDDWNYVTSVHPSFYSSVLKGYTDCLVYVPYFATSGKMSEGQAFCPAYDNADYIVVQSKSMIEQYDKSIPREKFLPLGSPKFDRVIRLCRNPPEPPEEWRAKMEGKRVYFYNTSIGGMLADTEQWLNKVRYVFDTFKQVDDACLIWRPHPLLQSTFESMRVGELPEYEALKRYFIEEDIGILDITPDVEATIAQCDAYIGDDGTSVTSLFGAAEKPIFFLNNAINRQPKKEEYKKSIFQSFVGWEYCNTYCITQGTKIYRDICGDGKRYDYHFFMDLDGEPGDYIRAIAWKGKIYVIPCIAQHVLVIDEKDKTTHRIDLKHKVARHDKEEIKRPAFISGEIGWYTLGYLILFPNYYPDFVRIDLETEKVDYVEGIRDYYITEEKGEYKDGVDNNSERLFGGRTIWDNKVLFCNLQGTELLSIDLENLAVKKKEINVGYNTYSIVRRRMESNEFWFIPYRGTIVTRWDMESNEYTEYDLALKTLNGSNCERAHDKEFDKKVLCSVAELEDGNMIFTTEWGNKIVHLNIDTGEVSEWIQKIDEELFDEKTMSLGNGFFLRDYDDLSYRYYYSTSRKLFCVDVNTKEISEVLVSFDYQDILDNTEDLGFFEPKEGEVYACIENHFNTLRNIISNKYEGEPFRRDKQRMFFSAINNAIDGECGKSILAWTKK